MSSHHVVRENQEPALVLLDDAHVNFELLGSVLEWSPHVITIESCVNYFIDKDIKVDVVFSADLDGLEKLKLRQANVRLLQSKDFVTDIIAYLEDNQHKGAYFFTTFSEKWTKLAGETSLIIVLIDYDTKWSFIKSGRIKKWWPTGTKLQLRSADNIFIFDQSGQKLNQVELDSLEKDGLLHIKSEKPFWLGERIV